MSAAVRTDVRVEAPDGAAALELHQRLERLGPSRVSYDDGWTVTVEDADPADVEAAVRRWLRHIGCPSTVVLVENEELRVRAAPRHVGTHADFIG
ncbi:MAG TPA: hypothetical protein VHC67_16200 [Gaiellaceae bacterium]|jgi:hypothetical protein|nr:hypothetical protein [Gaiellaceae bacterium]